jgi:hypothetical protein
MRHTRPVIAHTKMIPTAKANIEARPASRDATLARSENNLFDARLAIIESLRHKRLSKAALAPVCRISQAKMRVSSSLYFNVLACVAVPGPAPTALGELEDGRQPSAPRNSRSPAAVISRAGARG